MNKRWNANLLIVLASSDFDAGSHVINVHHQVQRFAPTLLLFVAECLITDAPFSDGRTPPHTHALVTVSLSREHLPACPLLLVPRRRGNRPPFRRPPARCHLQPAVVRQSHAAVCTGTAWLVTITPLLTTGHPARRGFIL